MTSSPLFCDYCGATNRHDARYCRACGGSLEAASSFSATISMEVPFHGTNTTNLLRQKYRIVAQLGQGGMGTVYQAEDTHLNNRLVALKEMSQDNLDPIENADAKRAFKDEADMLARLSHPNIPKIYECFFESGKWYLVMEYIDGETLANQLEKSVGGRLSLEEALDIGIKLCTVLSYLHTRNPVIIFRDLKPENIMLTKDKSVYLIDFGIARHFKTSKAKDTNAYGTPGYCALEQWNGGQTTIRSDIYSLGATLHQLLSGNVPTDHPFNFADLRLGNQQSVSALEKIVMKMVNMRPEDRPPNMVTVREELQRIQSLRVLEQQPTNPSNSENLPTLAQVSQPLGHSLSAHHTQSQFSTTTISASETSQSTTLSQSSSESTLLPPAPISDRQLLHKDKVYCVSWASDGNRIASAGEDRTVHIWNAATGEAMITYTGHSSAVRAISWSPDSKRIASGGWSKKVHVWNATTGKLLFSYENHSSYVRTLAWSPDGKFLTSAGKDKTVHVWNAATGGNVLTFTGHTDEVSAVAWSPDSRFIVSAGHDYLVSIWDVKQGQDTATFTYKGHTGSVYSVAWSHDGKYIASCGEDKTVWVWDVVSGKSLLVYRGHSNWVSAVAWSPDSKLIVSVSHDKSIRIWEAATEMLVEGYTGLSDQLLTVSWSYNGECIAYGDGRMVQVRRIDLSGR